MQFEMFLYNQVTIQRHTKQFVPPVLALLLALLVSVLSLVLSTSPVPVQVILYILHL